MEAPFLQVPSINVGTRQEGRSNTTSIINVKYNKVEIKKAIEKAIEDKKFLKSIKKQKNNMVMVIHLKKLFKFWKN